MSNQFGWALLVWVVMFFIWQHMVDRQLSAMDRRINELDKRVTILEYKFDHRKG